MTVISPPAQAGCKITTSTSPSREDLVPPLTAIRHLEVVVPNVVGEEFDPRIHEDWELWRRELGPGSVDLRGEDMCAGRNAPRSGGNEVLGREREDGRSSRSWIHPPPHRERDDEQHAERHKEHRVQPRSRCWSFEGALDRRGDQDREGEGPPHDTSDRRHPQQSEEGE